MTHALQQLGRERIELIKQLATAPAPPPSSDIASDFQVIESHLHAVAAKVQAQRVEESRCLTLLHKTSNSETAVMPHIVNDVLCYF